jgi:hypothetical protein
VVTAEKQETIRTEINTKVDGKEQIHIKAKRERMMKREDCG